eukprot:m.447047 g.447047  ORF g.447047 m.447047 type:complete len:117 (-) comp21499_c0_seq6:1686-2036(-)
MPVPSRGKSVRYRRIVEDDEKNGWTAAQFKKPKATVPYRAILFASTLFFFGSVFLIFGSCLYTGTIVTHDPERWLPMLVIGALMFIPGSYHTYLAYKAWRGDYGYSFDDIPSSFDD